MPDDPFGFPVYDDPIVIRFEIPWLRQPADRSADTAGRQAADIQTDSGWPEHVYPDRGPPLAPPDDPSATWPPARIIMANVEGCPSLGVSGLSDGELTLWRRGTDARPPQALAHVTLDRDTQLLAGGQFVGRLIGDETALFMPDWLHGIQTGLELAGSQLFGTPEAQAQEEESPGRRLGPGGQELSGDEPFRIDAYEDARRSLFGIEPNNLRAEFIHTQGWVPSWDDVHELQSELQAARAREAEAAARNDRTVEAYRALARDPDHGGQITRGSFDERAVILDLERRHIIPGFAVRGPRGSDFVDAERRTWDIKAFRSEESGSRGKFNLQSDAAKVDRQLTSGNYVVIDTTRMTPADVQALKAEGELRGWKSRVVWWP